MVFFCFCFSSMLQTFRFNYDEKKENRLFNGSCFLCWNVNQTTFTNVLFTCLARNLAHINLFCVEVETRQSFKCHAVRITSHKILKQKVIFCQAEPAFSPLMKMITLQTHESWRSNGRQKKCDEIFNDLWKFWDLQINFINNLFVSSFSWDLSTA